MNLVTPKAGAKNELLFNELASALDEAIFITNIAVNLVSLCYAT